MDKYYVIQQSLGDTFVDEYHTVEQLKDALKKLPNFKCVDRMEKQSYSEDDMIVIIKGRLICHKDLNMEEDDL